MVDILIIGGGPAGLSAAVNAVARGGTAAVISQPIEQNPLWKAKLVDNYSGMVGVSGADMLRKMRQEAEELGVTFITGRATAAMYFGGVYSVTVGQELLQGKRLILAIGAGVTAPLPNEERFLGRGVSYCATCDGRLYRGRRAVVTGNAGDLAEEAAFLQSVGVEVTVVTRRPVANLSPSIPRRQANHISLWVEGDTLRGLLADGEPVEADGVFLLRQVTAPATLLSGLITDGKFITVDRSGRTNLPGCYAAGDCTGHPLQIAKAVGEGLVAAQHAMQTIQQEKG